MCAKESNAPCQSGQKAFQSIKTAFASFRNTFKIGAEDPLLCVVMGTGKALEEKSKLSDVFASD